MAAGDLSDDQRRFVAGVASQTGLDPGVVTAWVGSESGWGVTKATHNYLNVGPSEAFQSVDQAINRVAGLLNNPTYAAIKSSVAQGATAQIQAIGASKWGTNSSTLTAVAADVLGNVPTSIPQATKVFDPFGIKSDAEKIVGEAAKAGLSLVFVIAALALIGLGISRITAKPAGEAFSSAQDLFGKATTAAKFAAL